ncbi:cation transport protein ChaC [Pelomonas aquatica]|uniref:glutathione-specific gamma-glutamylcyclotransferase n=1 Tax=Pelomonas aquatica TaxID=431058 RepID=A0ABU1ZFI7_9BURK|nr:gamma-glutamylcyclotransferase [Pelomonas aquatica]MDR7299388.1 cation transport protein ChaC [Pelomonas aquatica]
MASQAINIPHGPARSEQLLLRTTAEWRASGEDLLLFAYGSLIWRPEFEYAEALSARVLGFHRVLRMRSRVNRGSPQQPGLVLALISGGSCRGLVYRIPRDIGDEVLPRLWAREMPNGVYEPRWLNCDTASGRLKALAFTLSRQSPNWTGALHEPELLHIFQHASGRYGTTLDYLLRTVQGLREHGIRDMELERQVHLAAQHGLCAPL